MAELPGGTVLTRGCMAKRQTQASKSNEEIRPKASGLGGLSPGAWSAIVAAIGLVGTLVTLAIPRLIPNPPPLDSTTAAKTVVALQTRANPGASALTFQIEGPDKLVLGFCPLLLDFSLPDNWNRRCSQQRICLRIPWEQTRWRCLEPRPCWPNVHFVWTHHQLNQKSLRCPAIAIVPED